MTSCSQAKVFLSVLVPSVQCPPRRKDSIPQLRFKKVKPDIERA